MSRFRPLRPYALRRLNNRTHRKVLVADGAVGMIGGVGIAEEWTGDAQDPDHWRDTHVRVRGPVVRGLQGAFAENWLEATGDALVGDAVLPPLEGVEDGVAMQVVRSRAGVGDTNAEALYFLAIASARRSLDLTNAYFAPRPAFVEALCDAAERGVAVRVIVPGPHIDKELVRQAGRRAYRQLLDCGVRIWEYEPDDAPRQDAVPRRRLVLRRLGELRQPLVPAQRRGDALRQQPRRSPPTSRRSSRATSRSPRRCPRPAGGAGRCGAARPKRSRASPGASSDGAGR